METPDYGFLAKKVSFRTHHGLTQLISDPSRIPEIAENWSRYPGLIQSPCRSLVKNDKFVNVAWKNIRVFLINFFVQKIIQKINFIDANSFFFLLVENFA